MVEGFKPPRNERNNADSGALNALRKLSDRGVRSGQFPTELGYESTMGIYGGTITRDEEGKMVFDMRGFWNSIDQWGDRQVRAFDDHHARNPSKLLSRRRHEFWKWLPLGVDSKRYRGTPQEAIVGKNPELSRIEQLGLQDMYGVHQWGIEIKKPEVFTKSVGLQDIFRADEINNESLLKINRFQALRMATTYLWMLHQRLDGGIAEANAYSFLFAHHEDDRVSEPFLMVPTEIYNPEKKISTIEQKTTDLLDLLASAAFEELRRSKGNWASTDHAIDTVIHEYKDRDVIAMVLSYIKRGRLTLANDQAATEFKKEGGHDALHAVAALHNTQRLSADTRFSADVKAHIMGRCGAYLARAR